MLDISLFLKIEPFITNGMSSFQMDKFVIEDQITPYRKLKQAMIEAKARLETITSIGFDIEELEVKKLKSVSEKEICDNEFDKRLKDIEYRKFDFELNRKRVLLNQLEKEATFFLDIVKGVVDTFYGGNESVIRCMADPTFQETKESEFWTKKLARSVFSDIVNYNVVSKGVLESLTCLPLEQRKEILNIANEQCVDFNKLMITTRDEVLTIKD